jgi:hypothetical protein
MTTNMTQLILISFAVFVLNLTAATAQGKIESKSSNHEVSRRADVLYKKVVNKSEEIGSLLVRQIKSAKPSTDPLAVFLFDSLRMSSIPVQVSVVPGLSTHGILSDRIINNFSLNIFGGRTGGVSGAEIGGLFNINTGYVRSVQVAGLFNLTGAYVQGVQVGGLFNNVNGYVQGVQIGGLANRIKGSFNGTQVGGLYNHIEQGIEGIQIAGLSNYTRLKVKGIQLAGINNFSKQVDGLQVAGIFNYTKKLHGLQIGLINVADSSDGYSIGLVNIVPHGYHKLMLSTNEVFQMNAAFKTGNNKLYSILLGGINAGNKLKAYSFGYGLGAALLLGNNVSINPEITSQYVYLGTFKDFNLLNKFHLDLHIKPTQHFSFFAGPSFAAYYSDQKVAIPGYKLRLPNDNRNRFKVATNITGWLGWNVGVSFF